MKLALIRRQFAVTGGAELYAQRLLSALVERGHEVHLLAESWDRPPPSVTLHSLRLHASRAERPMRFAEAVQTHLAGEHFDCVFSLERTRRQDVYRAGDGVHRVWLRRRRRFAHWWRKPFVGLGAFHRNVMRLETETFDPRNTRHVIVNSEMVKREILEHFPFPSERIHLVRNGVDVARFENGKRTETRSLFDVKHDEFLLLFVGSGWERKGLNYLLAALRRFQMRGVPYDVGAGARRFREATSALAAQPQMARHVPETPSSPLPPRPDRLKLLVVGKGKRPVDSPRNVIFAGPMSNVEDAYAAADLFVTLPIYEPSANAVFEAMAAGLPVVTTAQNGASEAIEPNVNGTVIDDPSDFDGIVSAITYWCSRRLRLPKAARAHFNLDRNVSETLAVIEMASKEKTRSEKPGAVTGSL